MVLSKHCISNRKPFFEGGNHNGLAGVSKTAEGLKKPFCRFEAYTPHRQGLFKLRSMLMAVALKLAALIFYLLTLKI